jgi:S-adenosylmethionine hydrolase
LASADGKFIIRAGNGAITKMVSTFAKGAAGEAVGVIGSSGYLELSVNKGQASRVLGAGRGAEVTVELS